MARDLNPEKVISKAAELINQLGDPKQLKLKALAAELNIKVPSLYNHVKGTDGLLEGVHLHALKQLEKRLREAMAGKTGRSALLSAAHSYRAYAHANPGTYQLTLRTNTDNPDIAETSDQIVSLLVLILGSLGVAGDDAYHAVRGFRSVLHGFVSLELSGGFAMPLDLDHSFEKLVSNFLKTLEKS